ncbi:MAG: DinB family protein [Gemmataceae bacterium]
MSADVVRAVKRALVAQMEALRDEVKQLAEPLSEERFWKKPAEPGNSFGHLVLHLTGNLSHFVGARLGNTGYVRDREREFTEASVPTKAAALAKLDEAVAVYRRVVESLPAESLAGAHPDGEKMGSVVNALTKVLAHFALHRGQLSYIARLV